MAKFIYDVFVDSNCRLQMNKYKVVYENKHVYVIKEKSDSGVRTFSKYNIRNDVSQFLEFIHEYCPHGVHCYLDFNPKDKDPDFFKNDNMKTKYASQLHEAFRTIITSSNNISFQYKYIGIAVNIIEGLKTQYPDMYREVLDICVNNSSDKSWLKYLKGIDDDIAEEVSDNESDNDTETNS